VGKNSEGIKVNVILIDEKQKRIMNQGKKKRNKGWKWTKSTYSCQLDVRDKKVDGL
jgi:hypothetical protein